ncbi:MAG: glycoside hydrolase family 18 protein [Pseudomonadota bacterium]|nr:glycoside hydrolase family 18 protein [Pseudomonadota bacterium]
MADSQDLGAEPGARTRTTQALVERTRFETRRGLVLLFAGGAALWGGAGAWETPTGAALDAGLWLAAVVAAGWVSRWFLVVVLFADPMWALALLTGAGVLYEIDGTPPTVWRAWDRGGACFVEPETGLMSCGMSSYQGCLGPSYAPLDAFVTELSVRALWTLRPVGAEITVVEALEPTTDNAVWLRRRWLHEPRTDAEIRTLAQGLRAHGIGTIYPFVGPMKPDGRFGWRDGEDLREYDADVASRFFARAHAAAPGLNVLPWTGGVNERDVHLASPEWRAAFVAEASALVALGADGIQLNIEPMPSYAEGYLELVHELRAALGPDALLAVAAYPPPTSLHPYPDVHWEPAFLREVCRFTDDVSVMAYDTALPTEAAYVALMGSWTRTLAAALGDAGCAWRIGVPTYEDDKPWHRPDAETLDAAIEGVRMAGSSLVAVPSFRGLAIYAGWTTDVGEWATFDRAWRGVEPAEVEVLEAPI